ncbi:hypothetical protein BGY98DRAFT_160572 [Russula aff. rugulosa BPL654]|nr:hypothetical protein BGY98DRAFT_160572 [Russula aff. rugulosa BPL654]
MHIRAEQALYSQLRNTPNPALNNVWREFHSATRGAAQTRFGCVRGKASVKRRASASCGYQEAIQRASLVALRIHAATEGNVIVQEEDWVSIIAFILSSFDCQRELANLMNYRASHEHLFHIHIRCPYLRRHVNNAQCRSLVDLLLPPTHHPSGSLVRPTA